MIKSTYELTKATKWVLEYRPAKGEEPITTALYIHKRDANQYWGTKHPQKLQITIKPQN